MFLQENASSLETGAIFPQTLNPHVKFQDFFCVYSVFFVNEGSLYQKSMVFLEECKTYSLFSK